MSIIRQMDNSWLTNGLVIKIQFLYFFFFPEWNKQLRPSVIIQYQPLCYTAAGL